MILYHGFYKKRETKTKYIQCHGLTGTSFVLPLCWLLGVDFLDHHSVHLDKLV